MTAIASRQRAAELLRRYPELSDAETREVVAFLRHGRHLDVGLLTSDVKLKPKLDRFMADHAQHFRLRVGETSAVLAAITAFLAMCWLAWEALAPG
jgi:hypothetical protein